MSHAELLKSAQFLVDQDGRPAAVQISIDDWEALLDWIEETEDREIIKAVLPRLRQGPEQAGALAWSEISALWGTSESESEHGTSQSLPRS